MMIGPSDAKTKFIESRRCPNVLRQSKIAPFLKLFRDALTSLTEADLSLIFRIVPLYAF